MIFKKSLFKLIINTLLVISCFSVLTNSVYAEGSVVDHNGNTYTTISEAINAVSSGSVLTVTGSFTENITNNTGKAITINGDGSTTITGSISTSNASSLYLNSLVINGNVSYYGVDTYGSIKDCVITATSGTAVYIENGPYLETISGGSITASNYGIRMVGKANYSTRVEEISGVSITTTSLGSTSSRTSAAICLDNGWSQANSSLTVGTIRDCYLSCNGSYLEDAGIQVIRTTEVASSTLEIGDIINCNIDCFNGASGIFLHEAYAKDIINTHIHCNINKVRHSNGIYTYKSNVGAIKDSSFIMDGDAGTGLYLVQKSSPAVASISNCKIDAYENGIDLSGSIGDISDTVITSRNQNTPAAAGTPNGAILVKSNNATVGNLTNVTLNAGQYGLYQSSTGTIGNITDSIIDSGYTGIFVRGSIGDISKTSITARGNNHSTSFAARSCGINVANTNSVVGNITDTTIYSESYGIALPTNALITSISDTDITGRYIAFYNANGKIGPMNNVDITATPHLDRKQAFALYINGASASVVSITGGTITAMDGEAGYGIMTSTSSTLGSVTGTTINALNRAILTQANSSIGLIQDVNATTSKEMAIGIASGGSIGTINGGSYIGGTDALNLKNGSLGIITGSALFCGNGGYAINNESESSAITVEPGIPNSFIGDARYYGSAGQFATNSDIYPTFIPNPEVSSETIKYVMSPNEFVETIDGKDYHYLTVKCDLDYDPNEGQGNMDEDEYHDFYKVGITSSKNKYVRPGYTFVGWNTKKDGTGIDVGEEASVFEPLESNKVTLYAQWKQGLAITYKLNGGTYNGSTNDIVEVYELGKKIKIHAKPTRDGYTFQYWQGSVYLPGDEYEVKDNHTFTAIWKRNVPSTPVVVPNTSDK